MTDEIDKTLNERGKTHGDFGQNAAVSQTIKDAVKRNWYGFGAPTLALGLDVVCATAVQLEAIDFIAGKLGRINQNPNEIDHWRDIAGYATLVVRDMTRAQESLGKQASSGLGGQAYASYPEAPLRRG